MRDCHNGTDAVKARRTDYLPRPGGMKRDDDYERYLVRACFLDAVEQTEEVLSGMLFRSPPEINATGDLETFTKDVTLTGQPLAGFAQDTVQQLLITGRVAVLVDFPDTPGGGQVRPFFMLKRAEDVVFWRTGATSEGPERLIRVVFREDALVESKDDRYRLVTEHRVREYTLDDGDMKGVTVRVHAFRDGEWVVIDERMPKVYGSPLESIPVVIGNSRRLGTDIVKPPLLGVADMVLSLYRSSADNEQGNYYASLPTAYTTGAKMPRTRQQQRAAVSGGEGHGLDNVRRSQATGHRLGSGEVWELPKEGSAGYLEISGPGLESIRMTMKDKREDLWSIGAQLIEDRQRAAETAETTKIKAQKNQSILRLIANVSDQILTSALMIAAAWMGMPDADVSVMLNRSYLDEPPEEQEPNLSIDNWGDV